jgi:hypothetical protein
VRRGLSVALAALLLAAGCGGDGSDGKLDREDAQLLAIARERLDDAIDTAEVLRTDRAEARRLQRRVARSTLPDDVPSLVDDVTRRDFLRYAAKDPARAMRRPAAEAVATIAVTLDGKDAGERIRTLEGRAVERYLREAERDVEPIWPDLAGQLSKVNLD